MVDYQRWFNSTSLHIGILPDHPTIFQQKRPANIEAMRKKMVVFWLIGITLFQISQSFGQVLDSYAILDSMQVKLEEISDYSADIEIEVDVDFIKMPVKHARLFYKKPDKIKFKSEEFIMLPKRGIKNPALEIMKEPFTGIFIGTEKIHEQICHVIRIVPLVKNPEIILLTLWINSVDYRIARSESNTRKNGNFIIDFEYNDLSLDLPTHMIFSFEVENLNIPLKFIGKSGGMEIDKNKMGGPQEGRVTIRFSNYLINQEIPDIFFDEQEENN